MGNGAKVSEGAWASLGLDVKVAAVGHRVQSIVETRYGMLIIKHEVASAVDESTFN